MTFSLILAKGERRGSQAHTVPGILPVAISVLHLLKKPFNLFQIFELREL